MKDLPDASPMLVGGDRLLFDEEFRNSYPEFMRRHHFDADTADDCDMCTDMQRDGEFTQKDIDRLAGAEAMDDGGWRDVLRHWENVVLHYENDYLVEDAGWHEDYKNGEFDREEYEEAFAKWRRLLEIGERIWSGLAVNRANPPACPMFTEKRVVNGHVREPSSVALDGRAVPKAFMDAYVESVNALYRMSMLAESRGDPRIAERALHNRISLHMRIFAHLGLDHDSTGKAEDGVRKAIDAYTEAHANVPPELAVFTR